MAKMMNRQEAANFLGLSARTVYDRCRAGDIPAVRVGRVLRFDRAQLAAWKERQTINGPGEGEHIRDLPRNATERFAQQQIREQRQTNALLRKLVEGRR